MNKEIFFITSAPVVEQLPGYDLYDSFDLVSRGIFPAPLIVDAPQIIKERNFYFSLEKVQTIYTATSGQTLGTARLLRSLRMDSGVGIEPLTCLDNIRFSLYPLMSKREFVSLPSHKALARLRSEFIVKLYQGKFSESLPAFIGRLKTVLKMARATDQCCLFVVHSFFLQLLKIYATQPECFNDLKLLLVSFQPECKPFEPLDGWRALGCGKADWSNP